MAKIFKPFEHKRVIDCNQLLTERGDRVTHGDLVIIRCEAADFPANFADLKGPPEGVLAEGEHTAHAHQLFYDDEPMKPAFVPRVIEGGKATSAAKFTLKAISPSEMYLEVTGDSMLLKHQEHVPFRIPVGKYQVGIQLEYDPFEQMRRAVLD